MIKKLISNYMLANELQKLTTLSIVALLGASSASWAQTFDSIEEVVVTGVQKSLEDAAAMKRNSTQVVDAISSEDIGKLPDNNIAEALQRVTGVQISRDDAGEGAGFQVRGLSNNRLELNGRSVMGGGDTNSGSLSATSSSMIKAIEVYKTQSADMVEGSLGATVRLKTFQPLDFKTGKANFSVEGFQNSLLTDDIGGIYKGFVADQFDLGDNGLLGASLNLSYEDKTNYQENQGMNWDPITLTPNQPRTSAPGSTGSAATAAPYVDGWPDPTYTIIRPRNGQIEAKPFLQEKSAADFTLQYRPNDELEIYTNVNYFSKEQSRQQVRTTLTYNNNNFRLAPDYTLDVFSRAPTGNEYSRSGAGTTVSPYVYTPITTNLQSGILSQGRLIPPSTAQGSVARMAGNFEDVKDESLSYALGAIWDITDSLNMKAEIYQSTTTSDRDNMNTAYNPQITGQQIEVIDPETGESSLVTVAANPEMVWDTNTGNDMITQQLDFAKIETAFGLPAGSLNLTNPNVYSWNNFTGQIGTFENSETAAYVDFDWELDAGQLTSVEFGVRATEDTRQRDRSNMFGSGWNQNSIFGTSWFGGDGDPANNTQSAVNVNLSYLIPRISEDLPQFANFWGATDPILTDWSGDIINQVLQPTYDKGVWLGLLDAYFPGRDASPGPDGIACNNPANAGKPATATIPATCGDDITAIEKWGYRQDFTFPYDITQQTLAGYVKFNFEGDIGDMSYNANVGVRVVQTDVHAEGVGSEIYEDEQGWFYATPQDISLARTNYTNTGVQSLPANRLPAETPNAQLFVVTEDRDAKNSYVNTLPSATFNLNVTDQMILRFGASLGIARPDPKDLAPSRNIPQASDTGDEGNPFLKPQKVTSYDVSWEYYHDKLTNVSVGLFSKEYKDFLEEERFAVQAPSDKNGDLIVTEFDNLSLTRKVNGAGGNSKGLEISGTTVFDFLPSPLDGFGMQANYTYIDSEQVVSINEFTGAPLPIQDLSENSYNLTVFWEKDGFSIRAAYNLRDFSYAGVGQSGAADQVYQEDPVKSLIAGSTQYGAYVFAYPEFNDERGQLDISIAYTFDNSLEIFGSVKNALNTPSIKYIGTPESTQYQSLFSDSGIHYMLGVKYKTDF